MKVRITLAAIALIGAMSLSSCIVQQMAGVFVRDEYPGERPPSVIPDVNGKPASQKWRKINPDDLPPSGHIRGRIRTAGDGIPYGLSSEFSNVVISPYEPHYQLDYTGVGVGDKVWDPYTRKPFYIPRVFTVN